MIRSKSSFIGILTAFLMTMAPFVVAHADTASPSPSPSATPTADECSITQDDLAAVNAAAADGLTAELAARKTLLTRIIGCAKKNVQALEDDLAKVTPPQGMETFQSQLASKLDEAMGYYDDELAKVQDAGIAGTKEIANEVLAWRTGNYDPLANQVANYILWSENQGLFATAENRLSQVTNIVSFVEQAAPDPALAEDLTAAQSLITTATQENIAAQNALMQSAPSTETLALITSSLQSLSGAYQKFSDAGSAIQKLLPLSQASSTANK